MDNYKDNNLESILKKGYNKLVDFAYEPVNIDGFVKLYNESIDNYILKKEDKDSLEYLTGRFILSYVNEHTFSVSICLYFKNKNDEYIQTKYPIKNISKLKLKKESFKELKDKSHIKFRIEAPKRSINAI